MRISLSGIVKGLAGVAILGSLGVGTSQLLATEAIVTCPSPPYLPNFTCTTNAQCSDRCFKILGSTAGGGCTPGHCCACY